jgi:hypothetical protein|tara:strand:- start:13 stop:273 length:261 start_codon:yes stop_codon:yes gene_type:complete
MESRKSSSDMDSVVDWRVGDLTVERHIMMTDTIFNRTVSVTAVKGSPTVFMRITSSKDPTNTFEVPVRVDDLPDKYEDLREYVEES